MRRSGQTLPASLQFDAIGTPWLIDTHESLPPELARAVHARIEEFDRTYSRFRTDSLVSRIAAAPGYWTFPADAAALFETYRRLYAATGGTMSPLVGRSLEVLGYDRAYSLRAAGPAVAAPVWDDAFAWDGAGLATARPVVLDVGAAGKGYLVDIVGDVLADAGVGEFVIDASGDILRAGVGSIRVALEDPRDASRAIGVVNLAAGAICASASNRRTWGSGLHHVIDATTGIPTTTVIATWAMAESALVADGLATALFFAAPARLADEFDFTFVRMLASGRVEFSPDLDGELFT